MSFTVATALKSVAVLVGMLALTEVGRRAGRFRAERDPEGASKGAGPIEAAIFGLLGLLLAFTFSDAASRFEARRHIIVELSNAIGTAYLRLDLLPADAQAEIKPLVRQFIDARVAIYRDFGDSSAAAKAAGELNTLQGRIWTASVSASRRPDQPATTAMLLLPALNEMFDVAAKGLAATENHPPGVVFQLLIAFSLACSILAGYSMSGSKSRNWFYTLLVSVALSFTLYVIFDLEYPRFGLIRIDSADHLLIDLRNSLQ